MQMTKCMQPLAVMVLAMLILSGCSGLRSEYQEKKVFRLSADPKAGQSHETGEGLWVRRLDIASEFTNTSFMYRTGANTYASDYYHSYMVPPARMITDLIAETLYGSAYFSPVSRTSMDEIRYQLWGKITELYADIRDSSAPRAVVAIRLSLDRQREGAFTPVVQRTYTQHIPLTESSPDAYIKGVNQGLSRILDEFFTDFHARKDN